MSETVETETWNIEMMWDCSHCGTRNPGMSGKERESLKCSNCGTEKTEEPWVMPDSPETAPRLTGELDRLACAAANWTCPFCKGESRSTHNACEVCGATRYAETFSEPFREVPPPSPAERDQTPNPPREGGPYRSFSRPVEEPPPSRRVVDSGLAIKFVLAAAVAVLFGGMGVWALSPNLTIANVSRMTWARGRVLQERHSYSGEGWRSDAPEGVYSWDQCETRQSGTVACRPHDCNCRQESYRCNCTGGGSYDCDCRRSTETSCSTLRNGSARCTRTTRTTCSRCTTPRRCDRCNRTKCDTCYDRCPVYADWCSYRYYRWDQIGQARMGGEGHGAVWPDLDVRGPYQRILSSEEYTVRFNDTRSERTWVRSYSFGEYERFNVGQHWNAEWNRAGGFSLKGLSR